MVYDKRFTVVRSEQFNITVELPDRYIGDGTDIQKAILNILLNRAFKALPKAPWMEKWYEDGEDVPIEVWEARHVLEHTPIEYPPNGQEFFDD